MNSFLAGHERASCRILVALSMLLDAGAQYLSKLTLYELICSSRDFEDVKAALNERTNWSIELVSIFTCVLTYLLTSPTVQKLFHVRFLLYPMITYITLRMSQYPFSQWPGRRCPYAVHVIINYGRNHAYALRSTPGNSVKGMLLLPSLLSFVCDRASRNTLMRWVT